MPRYFNYLLLCIAGLLRLTPAWSQADSLCTSSPVGTYYVQGWAGSTFTWNTLGNGTIVSGQGNDTAIVSWNPVVGNYQLEVFETSVDGCPGPVQTLTIVVLQPTITLDNQPTCSADLLTYSVNVSTNGGVLTTSAGTLINTLGNSWTVSGIPSGTDIVLQLSNLGCSATLNITAPNCNCPPVSPPISTLNPSYCIGNAVPSISASVSAGQTIDWYDQLIGGTLLATSTLNYSPGIAGTFYAEARDIATGCVSNRTAISITENALPTVTVSANTTTCQGTAITLTASGANSYAWSPATGLSGVIGASVSANPSSSQTYTVTGTDNNSCVNTATVTVSVTPSSSASQSISICQGDAYVLPDGLSVTSSGTYSSTIQNAAGCDSVISTILTVISIPTVNITANICTTSSYTLPDGSVVNTAGVYPVTLSSIAGCDSIIVTTVNVQSVLTASVNASICSGDDYVLPDGVHVTAAGSYPVTLSSTAGCDSIVTTTLTVHLPSNVSVNAAVCQGDSYTLPDGIIVTAAGTFTSTLTGTLGCDSVITTTLVTHSTTTATQNVAICSGQTYTLPDGQTTQSAGPHISTIQNAAGCDSVITTNVSILTPPSVSITSSAGNSICRGSSTTLTANGAVNYTWSPSTGLSSTLGASVTAGPNSTVTYSVIGTNSNCADTATFTLTVLAIPNLQFLPSNPVICEGDSIAIIVNGASNYTWSPTSTLTISNAASTIAFPSITTTYSVIGSAGICSDTSSITVTVHPSPQLLLSASTSTVCAGSPTTLTAQGANSYSWQADPTLSATTGAIVTASPIVNTNYIVTGTTNNCSAVDSISIVVNPIPQISITANPDSVCSGEPVLLVASGATNYVWSPATGLSSTTNDSTIATSAQDITYYVTGTASNCSSIDSILVNIIAGPNLSITPASGGLCAGDSISISVSGAQSYNWTGSTFVHCDTCATITVTPDTSITLEVSGVQFGCFDTTSISLVVSQPINGAITGDTVMCASEELVLTASGGGNYLWNTGDTTAVITISPETTSLYSVSISSGYCRDTIDQNIAVIQPPVIAISEDTTIIQGGSASLIASGASQFFWTPSTNLSCDNCPSPIATPDATTEYCVAATNAFGCTASECVTVKVDIICDEFFIPNVFAPGIGGDEENDCLRLYGTNCVQELKFRIFNRWGELVFETTDVTACWDGTFKGVDQNAGVFVYYVEAKMLNEETVSKQGNITLLR